MTADRGILSRRLLLRCAAAGSMVLAGPLGAAAAETALVAPENDPTLVVAGQPDSAIAGWARLLLPSLTAGMAGGAALDLRYVGGEDGVTAANQFDARAMADGSQALLFPGCAALPWMAGDSRAQFDIGHFLPLLALSGMGVVMMRGGLSVPQRAHPVRLLCAAAPQACLTALMALDLLGVAAIPVTGSRDALQAVRAGIADAVFVHGSDVPGQVYALASAGLAPAFATGLQIPRAEPSSGHALHGVPHLLSLLSPAQRNGDPRVTAWRGVAAASALVVVLALPRLSAAASVTTWRRACRASVANDAIGQEIDRRDLQLLTDQETASCMQLMRADAPAQLNFRRWLADRLNWRPA